VHNSEFYNGVFSILRQNCQFCTLPRTPEKLQVLTQFAKFTVISSNFGTGQKTGEYGQATVVGNNANIEMQML